jgi:hypothetical protein
MAFRMPTQDEVDQRIQRIQRIVDRMQSLYGYTNRSARDALERVGHLLVTGEYDQPFSADGKIPWPYPY